jgi:hypothetical protein
MNRPAFAPTSCFVRASTTEFRLHHRRNGFNGEILASKMGNWDMPRAARDDSTQKPEEFPR